MLILTQISLGKTISGSVSKTRKTTSIVMIRMLRIDRKMAYEL
jgi:hypothetical protein